MSFEVQYLAPAGSITIGEGTAVVGAWKPYTSPFGGTLRMTRLDQALLIAAERAKNEGDTTPTRVVREADGKVLAVFLSSTVRRWM